MVVVAFVGCIEGGLVGIAGGSVELSALCVELAFEELLVVGLLVPLLIRTRTLAHCQTQAFGFSRCKLFSKRPSV